MRIAIFLAHPREDSFCRALADAYQDGAASAGAEVKLFWIDGFEFDPILHESSPRDQPLEPALREAQRLFSWADHLVFVFPTWWVTMPALLKGFFDRALVPGYAFYVDERSPSGYRPLLAQRSARLITTMDTPDWIYRWIYGRPGELAISRGILGFCGIKPVRTERVCRVKHLSGPQRHEVLRRLGQLGERDASKPKSKTLPWVRAMRLPFQGMTICSYGLGVAAAIQFSGASPAWPTLFAGFLALGFIAIASVFLNEVHDLTTDQRNLNAGPFTGGSRVLVNRELFPAQLQQAARRLLAAAPILLPAALHTVMLLGGLGHFAVTGGNCRRMDLLLFAALTHILWFTLGPLLLILNT